MGLIEREWLINMLGISKSCTDCPFSNGPQCGKYNCFVSACEAIYKAPDIDAVEVVRCKDCKHSEEALLPHLDLWCNVNGIYCTFDYFCADGKRRDKENECSVCKYRNKRDSSKDTPYCLHCNVRMMRGEEDE